MLKKILEDLKKKNLGLSLTKIKVFEGCPYRYFLQYVEKVKVPKSAYNPKFFKRGQAFHKIIDSFIKTGVACDFNSTTLGDEVNDIKNLCGQIYNSTFVKDLLKYPHKSEYAFSLYIYEDTMEAISRIKRDADIYGIVDFYAENGDELIVVDWKTGRVASDADDTFLQVYLYAKALQLLNKNKFKRFKVGYYYVEHQVPLFRELTIEELDSKIADLVAKAYKIPNSEDKKDFPALPGKTCEWCPFGSKSLGICEFE